jgi:uncharacterized phage-associated protein
MASARDVAMYLLSKGTPQGLCLQKLLYYSQAWALVWNEQPLFPDKIRAWDLGPVVGDLWHDAKSGRLGGDPARLTDVERATVDAVFDYYGHRPAEWLSELTHRERPWADVYVREVRPCRIITHEAMRQYYGAVPKEEVHRVPDAYRRGAELLMSLTPEELAEFGDDRALPVATTDVEHWLRGQGPDPWPL